MAVTRDTILEALTRLSLPDGGNPVSRDMIRALSVDGGTVRFVIEAPSPELAQQMTPLREAAQQLVAQLPGVENVSVVLTAHGPTGGQGQGPAQGRAAAGAAGQGAAPSLKIGGHPKPQTEPLKPAGVKSVIAIASGKGGVGKSTVSSNLAVALARAGRRVGLLDADIYGPSQPRMMGNAKRAASPDGKIIEPLTAHGVTFMSIGSMMEEGKAVVWRGPMLMGAMQQLLGQVAWGELDILLIDLPPGTGDVQLTLGQRSALSGAIVVSTPQDVALLDARKAIDMFHTLKVPVMGLIENMSSFICPHCGGESHPFGHGGVAAEAERLGAPLLASLPLDLDTRLGGDAGQPIASGDSPAADAYAQLADRMIQGGVA
ncbi:Mrp/NBP35 family ATP-binding protein [Pseudooceanicola aestuarii]|uniref:Mrp/NBP35 family ATP-binding protein n=1 Tax=Pseudooceanicola aestuarii TaxID=2697319 RepID=UPI0013D4BC1A|nr:Mrp/NBP35 family ATP-binding protein [Pseudooceanicola aestuarii]